MRFAGTRMEGLLSNNRPDSGAIAQAGNKMRADEEVAITDMMGKTAATGIGEAGKVEAANIVGAAQQQLASAQSTAAILGGIGDIAGSAIEPSANRR